MLPCGLGDGNPLHHQHSRSKTGPVAMLYHLRNAAKLLNVRKRQPPQQPQEMINDEYKCQSKSYAAEEMFGLNTTADKKIKANK